jgi:hypothetical protein
VARKKGATSKKGTTSKKGLRRTIQGMIDKALRRSKPTGKKASKGKKRKT